MNRVMYLVLLLGTASPAFCQQFDYVTPVTWSDNPVLHTVPSLFGDASAVTILDERSVEFRKDGSDLAVFQTIHKIVHIRDDKGIEMFNKMYLPVHEGATVSDIKARTITAAGKVIDVTPDKIKSTEEDGSEYRQFALDGVEKGAEVEYYYTEKRAFYLFGSEFYQNGGVPCVQARFLLIGPPHLRFSVKGYNGFRVSEDSLILDKRVVAGYGVNIKDLPDEKYASKDQYLSRVDFKLSYNLGDNDPTVRLYTWKDLGKRAYAFYTDRNEKDEKALASFASSIPDAPDSSLAGRIAFLEDYIKTHIDIDKKLTATAGDQLPEILTTKTANEEGVIRLFTGLLDLQQIDYELVLPSDRDAIPLDPDLENWDRAGTVLFYFPKTRQYLDPTQQETRYPYVRPNLVGTKGLFLKNVQLVSFKTAIATFGMVPVEPYDSSCENMEADLRFNQTLDTLYGHGRQIMRGYASESYRPIYTFYPKDKQDEASKDIVKAIGNSSDVSDIVVTNQRLTDCFHNLPLTISADLRWPDLIENAGSRILLKIGEIIGTQVQMYQERPRQLPAEMDFPHEENRTITLHIPDGYVIRNVKDLSYNVVYPSTGTPTMGFVADYTLTGSTLVVHISEFYRSTLYPLSQFDDFKRIINTSADFNKVVLVLEKSGS